MRLINRLLAAILAVAVIAAGVIVIVEVIVQRVGKAPLIAQWPTALHWAGRTDWQQGSVRVASIVLIVLGLILLAVELKRSRPSRLTAVEASPGVDTAYTRRGVANAVSTAVTAIDGVRSARVTVRRRRIAVRADTSARDTASARSLQPAAEQAAASGLSALQLQHPPRLSVSTRPRKS